MISGIPPSLPPPGPVRFDFASPPAHPTSARRASVMLWIFGGLSLLSGVCLAAVAWLAPMAQLIEQMGKISPEQAQQFSTPQMQTVIRIGYAVFGALGLVTGIILLATAWFVRQGRRGAVITALVGSVPIVIWAILTTFGGMIALAMGNPLGAVQVFLGIIVAGLIGLTISWLFQALRPQGAGGQQRVINQQYWQFMQQQQVGGYGYGTPPPLPPPPTQSDPNQ